MPPCAKSETIGVVRKTEGGVTGIVATASVAALEVTVPAALVTTTRNVAPSSPGMVAGVVYDALVAPAMLVVPRCHWYDRRVPVAATVNVAVSPSVTEEFAGCVVMAGGTFTVRVALLLVTLPFLLDTTTRNVAASSAPVVAGVV